MLKAVILVGGEGTRLQPLTLSTPKAMVPIVNRPFLEHMFSYLKGHGIDDIVLTLCYLPDPIQSYFAAGGDFGVRLTYAVEEFPLGTAGAVKNVSSHVDETFFVFNGDTFTDIDLTAMLDLHRRCHARATIALTPVEDPTVYGVVETDTDNRVQRFVEKPNRDAVTTNMINAGAYILEPEVLNLIPKDTYFMFEQKVFPPLLEQGEAVYGYESEAYWIDIGTPDKYMRLHRDLLAGRVIRKFPGTLAGEGAWIDENCSIHPQAVLEGPAVIGKNCTIEAGVKLMGPCVIGPNCTVEPNSSIEGCVIWQNVHLGQSVSLKDCIIGDGVSIGDGSKVEEDCILGHNVVVGSDIIVGSGTSVWPD